MTTAALVLRIIAAELDCLAEILKKADAAQVQPIIERHNQRMARWDALLDKLGLGN